MKLSWLGVLGALVVAGTAGAVQVNPVSYDMPNGSSWTFNYWDESYSGSGCTTCDLSPLSGGLGDLTDGVIATTNWNVAEAPPGPGPYVGWLDTNPVIDFHFGGPVAVDSITFHFDSAMSGGVAPPTSVIIGAQTFTVPTPGSAAPFAFTVSGLGFTGSDLSLSIVRGDRFLFVSEVTFQSPVPEATTSSMLLAGFLMMAAVMRRRSRRS